MNVLNSNSGPCARVRRHLDAYLSKELLVETTGEVLRHLESCESCSRELDARTQVRDALRRVAASQIPPQELRQSIQDKLREKQPGLLIRPQQLAWTAALAILLVVGSVSILRWVEVHRGRQIVDNLLALGVADHLQCAIKGHNYPDIANSPEQLRQKLGRQYAGLLDLVQQKLPGFEILEAHICSIPGSPRKYVHFITRGRATLLSVILTRNSGAQFPNGRAFAVASPGDINLYVAHLDGMNVAGFESSRYFGFIVSDLEPTVMTEIARELAPPLKAALDASSGSEARLDLCHVPQ